MDAGKGTQEDELRLFLATWEKDGRLAPAAEEELRAVFEQIRVYSTGGVGGFVRRLQHWG